MRLNELADEIHSNAVEKGFWEGERNVGEMLMLATSELAEALESHRASESLVWYAGTEGGGDRTVSEVSVNPDGSVFYDEERMKPEGVAVEIVDCIIRCLDTLRGLGVTDIEGLVSQKIAYNAGRERLHGKRY